MSVNRELFVLVCYFTTMLAEMPEVPKCRIQDSSCMKAASQAAVPAFTAGMPEIGTEPLDVMHIDHIKLDLAGLKMDSDNINVKGLKKAIIKKVDVDMAKKQLRFSYDTDIVFKGHYKASGRLIILPISGDGELTIKLKKLHLDMVMPFDISKNADGKDMIVLKSHKFTHDVLDGAHFDLTGLFNGNKALSEPLLRFMNENWKLLSQEFGGPMLVEPNKKIFNAIKTYLKSQPIENIIEY